MLGLVAPAAIVAMELPSEFYAKSQTSGAVELGIGGRKVCSYTPPFEAFDSKTGKPFWTVAEMIANGDIQVLQRPAVPMFLGYPHGPKTADWAPERTSANILSVRVKSGAHIEVEIDATSDSFACSDRSDAPLQSSLGGAISTLDNGLYDRTGDWLISAEGPSAHVTHVKGRYHLSADGPTTVNLVSNYYRNHLGYFLWDQKRSLWTKPVAGWCSWAAYGQEINEGEVAKAAEFFSKNLKPYGFDVIQIDDGYQRVLQLTDHHQPITEPFADYWTKPNSKFPSGMKALAEDISGLGMTPGIWVGLYLPLGLNHADAYVTGPDGKPLQGPWVGYSMEPGNKAAVAEAYTDALKTFRQEGWRYFKIDTLRHVLYDSYRRVPDYWQARHTDSSHAFRDLFTQVRAAVGRDNYLLACWGALPELAGLPDGCRIGEDVGPSFASMRKSAKYIAQFHHANNVVWRNDPDYMCLRVSTEECQTWATLTSLTGGHVMVSDPVEAYDPERVDILRRVGPPLVTKPGNVLPLLPDPEWVLFNGLKSGENWAVAARMAWVPLPAKEAQLSSLGLDPSIRYLAFDFWKSKFLGTVRGTARFNRLAEGTCQVVGFRPSTGNPQVLGDDRHVAQGAIELDRIKFADGQLSGRFLQTRGKSWRLFVFVPEGWELKSANVDARLTEPRVVEMTIPAGIGWKAWRADFASRREPGPSSVAGS